jgi:hypothetical protein
MCSLLYFDALHRNFVARWFVRNSRGFVVAGLLLTQINADL